jgi:hypothetical protein
MAQTLLISETAEPLGVGLSNSQFFHKQRATFLSGGGGGGIVKNIAEIGFRCRKALAKNTADVNRDKLLTGIACFMGGKQELCFPPPYLTPTLLPLG